MRDPAASSDDFVEAFRAAFGLLAARDPELVEIVVLSLRVTGTALALAALVGLPFGAWLGIARFRGRALLVAALNAGMALPPVAVGLAVYLLLSRSGPLGALGLLFTPAAMVIAQTVIAAPIVAALTRQVTEDLWADYGEQLRALGAGLARAIPTLLFEGRWALATACLAAFGRILAEVGAVLVVGGNIAHVTRVMTTAIVLETSRGELALALGLGLLLIGLSLLVSLGVEGIEGALRRGG
jgi:tungstate transport system permease protein